MFQSHLIDRIIDSVPGMKDTRSTTTPVSADFILTEDVNIEAKKYHWKYKSVIWMLN